MHDKIPKPFGQVYIEALAASVPMVCTKAGIAASVINEANAIPVPFQDADAIYVALKSILSGNCDLQNSAMKSTTSSFAVARHMEELFDFYGAQLSD